MSTVRKKSGGFVVIPNTALAAPRGARRERLRHPSAPLTLVLHLRSRATAPHALEQVLADVLDGNRAVMTRKEFNAQFGALPADVRAVRAFARAHRFRVSAVSLARRTLRLHGPGDRLARAFKVRRVRYRMGDVTWNSFTGSLHLPQSLADIVLGVMGFDARPDIQRTDYDDEGGTSGPMAAQSAGAEDARSYTAHEVAAMYNFPQHLDGRGQAIGVIALGGGYLQSDLRAYFRALRLKMPDIRALSVDGTRNAPWGSTQNFDGEVTGDVETVGALAPRARITVYFAPNSAKGFYEAVSTAVHDARARNTVLSISWGQAEVHWHRSILLAFNQLLLEAAVLGVTVCCSSGDWGAFADTRDRTAHVNFPASSPYALACGGTTLDGRDGVIRSERVWHNKMGASGGGVSVVFPLPHWQTECRVPRTAKGARGRGVPDVAANADPLTGYRIYAHGGWHVGAGTSASAPLWAGLIARLNQERGEPIGLATAHLYKHRAKLHRTRGIVSVTKGSNGVYRARRGWDCCTGLGTPRVQRLLTAISKKRLRDTKRGTR